MSMGERGEDEGASLLGAASPPVSRRATLDTEASVLPSPSNGSHAAASRALQASHALSTWGQRGWEFAVGLIMLELHPSSLALVALWGLLDSALSVACGAAVGAFVDARPRLQAASRMIALQNLSVAASAALALALLWSSARSGWAYQTGLGLTMAVGAVSTLGALGSTLSVEREWTKTLCGGDSSALAALNAAMKRIDLTCLIASPILVGLIMQYAGGPPMVAATLTLLAWNLLAWMPEVALLRYAQRCSPVLAADRLPPAAEGQHKGGAGGGSGEVGLTAAAVANGGSESSRSPLRRLGRVLQQQARSWRLYASQPAAAAAEALALLYLTVLSWGTLMTAYLKSQGLPEAELAVYRGLGALSGILATLTFPRLHRRLGLIATGSLSIWLQLAALLGAVAPAVAAAAGAGIAPRARLLALVWGLVLSRFGLWSFDLAANQLIQETADHSVLGTVNGVQGSLQSLCQMLAYLAGVLVPGTGSFVWLMAGSCCMVALATALVTAFAARSGCGRVGLAGPTPQPLDGL